MIGLLIGMRDRKLLRRGRAVRMFIGMLLILRFHSIALTTEDSACGILEPFPS
jgi:hypothetical protein